MMKHFDPQHKKHQRLVAISTADIEEALAEHDLADMEEEPTEQGVE
jgi:hypothetical protein